MPLLKWFPTQGPPRTYVLYKPVSTIGHALGNDLAVPTRGISETHAQVIFDGRDFNLEEVDKHGQILINGKKKRRARLVHGDRLTLGDAELSFSIFDYPPRENAREEKDNAHGPESQALASIAGLRKLYEFSEKLMTHKKLEELLEAMLDALLEVTG